MLKTIQSTIADLKVTFAHIPRPKDGEWYERSYPEPEIIESIFIGQKLEDITLDQVWNQGDVISWLTPGAFVYFLPRLAELCLENPEEACDLFHSLEFPFIKPETGHGYSWDQESIDDLAVAMTQNMRASVRLFLQLFHEIDPDGLALKRYWL